MTASVRDTTDALSVPEMLRIMDVATALRQDRELVEEQLNLDELKSRLRERMIAASKVTGEEVSPEEVDAAIETYYSRLHTFQEPKWSFPVALAHLWVRRGPLLRWGAIGMGSLLLGWWLFFASSGPFSATGRTERELARITTTVDRREAAIRAVSQDEKVTAELTRLQTEAQTYADQKDTNKLRMVESALARMEARVLEEYTISVVSTTGRKSGIDRYFTDKNGRRISGYYLIVEAKDPGGKVLSRTIRNSETDQDATVESWGERVSKEVYDRIAQDKKADGIVNETTFAVKKRGFLDEDIVMPGPDGQPLKPAGQITSW